MKYISILNDEKMCSFLHEKILNLMRFLKNKPHTDSFKIDQSLRYLEAGLDNSFIISFILERIDMILEGKSIIKEDIQPCDLRFYSIKLCTEFSVKVSELTNKDFSRIEKYISLFIDVLC